MNDANRILKANSPALRLPDGRPATGLTFPPPVPISDVAAMSNGGPSWLWDGYLPERAIVLLTALWKAGKTTLLAHLLQAISEQRPDFLGRALRPAKAVLITQESDDVWAGRMAEHGLSPEWVFFQRGEGGSPRPFPGPPTPDDWKGLCAHLASRVAEDGFKLVVIDPLADFWPVGDENSVRDVREALLPVRALADAGACVLLVHHARKTGGQHGTAHRGSGQLPAFADVTLELHRVRPRSDGGRLRKIVGLSRYSQTPPELHICLCPGGYEVIEPGEAKDGRHDGRKWSLGTIKALLPAWPKGITHKQLHQRWPGADRPSQRHLRELCDQGASQGLRTYTIEIP